MCEQKAFHLSEDQIIIYERLPIVFQPAIVIT